MRFPPTLWPLAVLASLGAGAAAHVPPPAFPPDATVRFERRLDPVPVCAAPGARPDVRPLGGGASAAPDVLVLRTPDAPVRRDLGASHAAPARPTPDVLVRRDADVLVILAPDAPARRPLPFPDAARRALPLPGPERIVVILDGVGPDMCPP